MTAMVRIPTKHYDWLSVRCTYYFCKAEPGERCHNAKGKPCAPHQRRLQAAKWRAEHQRSS
jgi:hypothetical protein